MKKIFFALALLFSTITISQDYKAALGIKSGYPGFVAVNGKFFIGEKFSLDNFVGLNFDSENRFVIAQLLVQYNFPIGNSTGYNWYVGLGPTVKKYTSGGYLVESENKVYEGLFVRADAALGVEVTPYNSRVNIAIEAGPNINFMPIVKPGFFINVALRYVFKGQKKFVR